MQLLAPRQQLSTQEIESTPCTETKAERLRYQKANLCFPLFSRVVEIEILKSALTLSEPALTNPPSIFNHHILISTLSLLTTPFRLPRCPIPLSSQDALPITPPHQPTRPASSACINPPSSHTRPPARSRSRKAPVYETALTRCFPRPIPC